MIERLPTGRLAQVRDAAEAAGDWERFERCEEELERREAAESDPAYQAGIEEAEAAASLDPPWWEDR